MAFLAGINWLKAQAVELLLPSLCSGCGKEGAFFCASCRRKLPYIRGPVCSRCGKPGAGAGTCADCHNSPPAVDAIRAPFIFDGIIRSAIHQFKYKDIRALAHPLAEFLFACIQEHGLSPCVLVPVPLHRNKLKGRGYNQAELLALALGKLTGWAVESGALLRLKDAGPQARTGSARERSRNVQGAFSCRDGRLKGKAVLLIDDVCTTGATLSACAQELKKLPVASVGAMAVAREL
ncbi:MAG: ComF family protein [Chloroflexi bacterium]|nr:ComF family protein [Chloroflexota bacterium]